MSDNKDVSILITSYNDFRILTLIPALINLSPKEIIIADGGSKSELAIQIKNLCNGLVKFHDLPGNVAETRYKAQALPKGNITVFIDTDEEFMDGWIEELTNPIKKGVADFTFGSTIPSGFATNKFSRYQDKFDSYFYNDILPKDVSKGPMGNSAWKTEIIREIGFDPCLGMGGEDYDLNLRAIKAGYKGLYVKNAIVKHDQNGINTFKKFIFKRYHYQLGAALAYKKNDTLTKSAIRTSVYVGRRFKDPLEIVIFMTKVIAFFVALIIDPWDKKNGCNQLIM